MGQIHRIMECLSTQVEQGEAEWGPRELHRERRELEKEEEHLLGLPISQGLGVVDVGHRRQY